MSQWLWGQESFDLDGMRSEEMVGMEEEEDLYKQED